MKHDPRTYQIAALTGLLAYGMAFLDFAITPGRTMLLVGTALLTQFGCTQFWRLPAFDPRSALISALSLCLLLRTNTAGLAVAGAVVTIASKFIFRSDNRHIFNPTNFGLVVMMILTNGRVWVSPGQWGNVVFFAFLMVGVGGLVVNRASRSDVTLAFLAFFAAIQFSRAWWVGQPMTVPSHRLENGALLLFAFFMISDPKTTPTSRTGRILFAGLVAAGAGIIQFGLYRNNGLLWSLAAVSPVVPLLNRWLPGQRYEWKPIPKGIPHETTPAHPGLVPVAH